MVHIYAGNLLMTTGAYMDAIKAFEDISVSRVIVPLFVLGKDPVAGLNAVAENIIAKLAP